MVGVAAKEMAAVTVHLMVVPVVEAGKTLPQWCLKLEKSLQRIYTIRRSNIFRESTC
jgi:hypothetical protein